MYAFRVVSRLIILRVSRFVNAFRVVFGKIFCIVVNTAMIGGF